MRGIETRSDMVNELEEWARTVQSGALVPPEDVALWQMQIAEVTTNGFQHGSAIRQMEPEEIFVAGSTYPKEKYVQLAALDLGSGIPRVIERILYEEHGNHDGDLIEYACAKGVTSRCVRENQGAGLHSLCETVKQNGGSMIILSHNGLHEVASKQPRRPRDLESLDARPPDEVVLDGTLTVINLHIREKEAA